MIARNKCVAAYFETRRACDLHADADVTEAVTESRQPDSRIPCLSGRRRNYMAAKKKSSGRKSGGRKYGKAAGKSVKSAMHREKRGTLKSGRGGKGGTVKSRKQAIAIGLSEARKKGAKVPRRKKAA
jgi:hypothetical protein